MSNEVQNPASCQTAVSGSLPNEIDLMELKKLLRFSDRYQISIQFWPQQTAVYIAKDGVDLTDFGGDINFSIRESIKYLVRITGGNGS